MAGINQGLRFGMSDPAAPLPRAVPLSIALNIFFAIASIVLALSIFDIRESSAVQSQFVQQMLRLGRPVIVFVAIIALLPAAISVFSTVQLLRRRLSGRYAALALQYIGFVLCVVVLAHQLNIFLSFELVVDGVMENPWLLLGFPIAYGLFWLGGRRQPQSGLAKRVETAGILLGMATLIAVLFLSNILTYVDYVLRAYAQPLTWVATALAILLGFSALRLLHSGEYFSERQDQVAAWQGWLLLSPNIIGFVIFFAGPLLLSLYLSFTNSTVGAVPEFTGLENYGQIFALEIQPLPDPEATLQSALSFGYTPLGSVTLFGTTFVLGARDSLFWLSLRNTIVYCAILVPLSVIPALGLALVLNSKLPGVKLYRAIYFLPSVAAVVGTALIWRWLYDPTIGYINYAITGVVNFLNSLGLQVSDPQIAWLTGPGTVLISMVILSAWQVVGFNTVLFLAGLQGIPNELNEAAAIDGASGWRTLRYITIPMLAPTTFFVIITTIITGLQAFNEPYALFPALPIPENAVTAVYYLYNQGFFRFNFGYASAIAWVVFALIFVVTLAQFRLQRSNAYE